MAEAEYVCIHLLINNTSSQAKDAFCSSTAPGWLHCLFPAISSMTFQPPIVIVLYYSISLGECLDTVKLVRNVLAVM